MSADLSPIAIQAFNLGKMYRLYSSRQERILDALGLSWLHFWKKKQYQEFWALRGINLSVRKGERVGIIGHNGAGKSTLLKTLIGAHLPTEGSMKINGRIQALMQLGTGFHPDFTGRENIQAALGYNDLTSREIKEKEQEIIDFTELDYFIDQPVKNYSAGMYARLAFATATAIKPEILIIDEVLGAGDAYFAGKCVERMKHLSVESGATVLFVSHDLASVQNMCDRCIWIDRGLLRADGPALDVIKAYSAQVREREELRLKIRNEKKLQRNQSLDVDYSVCWTFRFRSANGNRIQFPIKKISFSYEDSIFAEVYPGMPLDLSTSQPAYLYVNGTSNGWSDPIQNSSSAWLRSACLEDGRLAMGSFVVQAGWSAENIKVELQYQDAAQGEVLFEYLPHAGSDYEPAQRLQLSGSGKFCSRVFALKEGGNEVPADSPEALPNVSPDDANDVYGSGECIIRNVRFVCDGQNVFTIPAESPVEIVFEYEAKKRLHNPIFVFAAYLPSGQVAIQIWQDLKGVCPSGILEPGKGTFSFKIEHLRIGAGHYIASAAIFKTFPGNGIEPPAYHLLDRKIEFQIITNRQQLIMPGICIQEYTTLFKPGE